MDNGELVLSSSDRNLSCSPASIPFQKIEYVSSSEQWEARFNTIAFLYQGMTLAELQSTMVEIYEFKARYSANQLSIYSLE
jgi:hypothetical protein